MSDNIEHDESEELRLIAEEATRQIKLESSTQQSVKFDEIMRLTIKKFGCTQSQFSRAVHIYLPDFIRVVDLLKVEIQDKIKMMYSNNPDNINKIATETGVSHKIVSAYINCWILSGETLTNAHEAKFNEGYQNYLDNLLSINELGISVFGKENCAQIILLHMANNNLISREHYRKTKRGAIDRKFSFNISGKYINYIYNLQDGKSAISGIPLVSSYRSRHFSLPNIYSIDRIDSDIGYEEGNIQLISKIENDMKGILTQTSFNHSNLLISSHLYRQKYGSDEFTDRLSQMMKDLNKPKVNAKNTNIDVEFFDEDNNRFSFFE